MASADPQDAVASAAASANPAPMEAAAKRKKKSWKRSGAADERAYNKMTRTYDPVPLM